jgi:hypothetical protein
MSVSSKYFSNLRHDLLESIDDEPEAGPTFASNLDVHGMYETMRFVLRLSPRNHELMDMISVDGFSVETAPSEVIQAYSTYIHGKRPSNRMVDRVQWLSGVTSIGWWPLRWG